MTEVDKRKEESQYDSVIKQIVDDMTLFDDDLMSMVFDGNIPAAELLLRTILEDDGIEVISVTGQKELKNPVVGGRNIRLDILAKDRKGIQHNVEVQRSSDGANERRARFHSSMIDSRMLREGQKFKELRDSYVIFITEKDYFGYGLPVYIVNRHIEKLRMSFKDGSHIVYVNGSYRGNEPIGKLMQDFSCKDAKDMHYQELAVSVKHFKEEGGREDMCQAVEEYAAMVAAKAAEEAAAKATKAAEEAAAKAVEEAAVKSTIEDAISYGMGKEQIVAKVRDKYGLSEDDAVGLYRRYTGVVV